MKGKQDQTNWRRLGGTLERPPLLCGTAVDCEGMKPPPLKRALALAAPPPAPSYIAQGA
jgi:hypothetical protein